MDERRFDALVRSSAAASRCRALGGLLAVALAGFAAITEGDATVATCKGNFCSGKKKRCKQKQCFCFQRVGGGTVCAQTHLIACPIVDCATDTDCPAGSFCVQSGTRCCAPQATACAFACGA
jgi:hypothetical protein